MKPRRQRPQDEDLDQRDRWLVSYSDFITLLFAFFVVMYALSTLNDSKYRVVADVLSQAFRRDAAVPIAATTIAPIGAVVPPRIRRNVQPPDDPTRKMQEQKLLSIADQISAAMKPLMDAGEVRLTRLPRGLAVEINASALFAPGQAILQPSSVGGLEAVADVVARTPNQVQIEGHTDNLPIASGQYPSNWELSAARASSVVRLFASRGVAPQRLTAIGYADNRPVEENDTPEHRARNRRVTLLILSDPAADKDGLVNASAGPKGTAR